jgi:hypothetical protein
MSIVSSLVVGIQDGTLVVTDAGKRRMVEDVKRARDGAYALTIEPLHAARSPEANAFYWSVCIGQVLEQAQRRGQLVGWTPRQLHEYAKVLCLSKADAAAGLNGRLLAERYVLAGSTRRLTRAEFTEYLSRWRAVVTELFGITVDEAPAATEATTR